MLRDETHGADILNVRKALAFAGFTHRSPRTMDYIRADKTFDISPGPVEKKTISRGRSAVRDMREIGRGRAISM
jgi:protein-serine/threonine kinase